MEQKQTVLIVDDEPLIALMIGEELGDVGFDPVICHCGKSAMTALGDREATYCALVTDIRLGSGPAGWEVARCARELQASIPVVYITGDSAPDHSAMGVPGSILIQKPFVAVQIITALSNLLNSG